MSIYTNVGGQLKELQSIYTNVGGQLKELQSIYTNVGGELKEIHTMLPKPIVGTWHLTTGSSILQENDLGKITENNCIVKNLKFPKNRNIKVKMTINITDDYLYKVLSGNPDTGYTTVIFHFVDIRLIKLLDNGYYSSPVGAGSFQTDAGNAYLQTQRSYSKETIISGDKLDGCSITACRFAGEGTLHNTAFSVNKYYDNNLLSFDYSIEFKLV